jgi:hypothetical protein
MLIVNIYTGLPLFTPFPACNWYTLDVVVEYVEFSRAEGETEESILIGGQMCMFIRRVYSILMVEKVA